jgi:hypothetical protein
MELPVIFGSVTGPILVGACLGSARTAAASGRGSRRGLDGRTP